LVYFRTDEDSNDAIRKFMLPMDEKTFQTGLYQYKSAIYKTKAIDAGSTLMFNEDELRILVDNFDRIYGDNPELAKLLEVEELRELLGLLNNIDDPEVKRDLIANQFACHKMTRAEVRFADDLCQFWCSKCKRLFFEEEVQRKREYNVFKCPNDGRTLQITPIWVLKVETEKSPTTPLPVWISGANLSSLWDAWKNHTSAACPKCNKGVLNSYYSKNPARLMESSTIVCSNCKNEFRLYSANYSLTNASENLSQPFLVSTYSRNSLKLNNSNLASLLESSPCFDTSFVEEFLFAPEARIKEIVLGYLYGANITRTIKAKKFGRDIKTGALYLRLKSHYFETVSSYLKEVFKEHPSYYQKYQGVTATDKDLHKLVLHSLAHAFLTRLPAVSGVSLDSFSYIYDMINDAVLVYEEAPGGLGACIELSRFDEQKKEPIILEFFTKLRENIGSCTCDDRCKYCIATRGCQEWNEALSRFTLGPLLRLDAQDISWGF